MPVEYSTVSQIGKGIKPLAQNGEVAISGGTLYLRDSKGQEIVSAPVSQVTANSPWYQLGNGARVSIAGTNYNVTLKSLARAALTNGLFGVFAGRKRTKAFTSALAAAQAEAGVA
jgi:hypothetical protein